MRCHFHDPSSRLEICVCKSSRIPDIGIHAEAGDLSKAVDLASELAHLDFGYRDIQNRLDDWQARLRQAS